MTGCCAVQAPRLPFRANALAAWEDEGGGRNGWRAALGCWGGGGGVGGRLGGQTPFPGPPPPPGWLPGWEPWTGPQGRGMGHSGTIWVCHREHPSVTQKLQTYSPPSPHLLAN